MKLYATTTSERASKGQGGNEYLIIKIKDESQKEIAYCIVDSENIVFSIKDGKAIKEARKEKGEQQKGEKPYKQCKYCDGDLRDTGSMQCAMYHEKYQNK